MVYVSVVVLALLMVDRVVLGAGVGAGATVVLKAGVEIVEKLLMGVEMAVAVGNRELRAIHMR